jgi:hypothetical protein
MTKLYTCRWCHRPLDKCKDYDNGCRNYLRAVLNRYVHHVICAEGFTLLDSTAHGSVIMDEDRKLIQEIENELRLECKI